MTNDHMKKILAHQLSRIFIGLFICIAIYVAVQYGAGKVCELAGLGKDLRGLITGILACVAVIIVYRRFFGWVENRSISELSGKNLAGNLALGVVIGATLQCLTVLVIYLNGGFKVISVNPVSAIIIPMAMAFSAAIFEEIIIRGIIFRIMEEKLGSYIALIISAAIFGALHLLNPHATVVSAICIAIQAGLLLGAAYIYSRNLWLPIALHFAWNFTQTGIFGAITSGNEKMTGLLVSKITGPQLITGGTFGPEGTLQATVFCSIVTLVFMVINVRKKKLISYR